MTTATDTLQTHIQSAIPGQRGFRKGLSGNPKGRTKGQPNVLTQRYLHIKNLASQDYEKAYKILWEAIEAKEGWAHQLYFKELVPKKLMQQTVLIDETDDTLEEQINALRRGLAQFTEHTEESLLAALKVLNTIKSNEVIETQAAPVRLTREELREEIALLKELKGLMPEEEQKEQADE